MKNFGKSKTLIKFKNNLINFFSHKTNIIKAPMKLDGNPLQKKIWKEIIKIKHGKTKSYGEIAKNYNFLPALLVKYVVKITLFYWFLVIVFFVLMELLGDFHHPEALN